MTMQQKAERVAAGRSRRGVLVGIGATVLVVLVAISAWAFWPSAPPPADGDPVALAKFLATDEYESLSEEQKRPYMKRMRAAMDQITAARRAGELTKKQYEIAFLNAKFERKLDDMDEYFSHPASARQQVLRAEYAKKASATLGGIAKPSKSQSEDPPEPDDETEDDYFEDRVETWAPEQQAKWEEFRQAVKRAKEESKTPVR